MTLSIPRRRTDSLSTLSGNSDRCRKLRIYHRANVVSSRKSCFHGGRWLYNMSSSSNFGTHSLKTAVVGPSQYNSIARFEEARPAKIRNNISVLSNRTGHLSKTADTRPSQCFAFVAISSLRIAEVSTAFPDQHPETVRI